jgi:hypothetical protein
MKKIFGLAVVVLVFLSNSIFAQTAANANKNLPPKTASKAQFFPLSEIKPGMRGTAKTVFSGSEPEEFNVEILGVLPGFIGPKQPAIIGKLSGANAERTAVFAGMSGSPVFIEGKLVGAISFSFPFSKEPIAGITPIESMIANVSQDENAPASRRAETEPKTFSFTELASTDYKTNLPKPAFASTSFFAAVPNNSPLVGMLGQQFAPIATPLAFTGINQETINQFAPQLTAVGLMPVAATGAAAEITPLEKYNERTLQPGDSVGVSLVRGDYSLTASGTVTWRDGEKIYAFGHQFLNLGSANMPMSETSVVTVIPNLNNSFKLAVPGAMVGTLTQDRTTGIMGKLGEQPRMIPVELNVTTSRNQKQTYKFEVISDAFLTPLLMNIAIFNSITSTERALGDSTISVRGQINIKDAPVVNIERRFSAANAPIFAAGSIATPTGALLDGFENAEIKSVKIEVASTDGKKNAALERLTIDKSEVKAGETLTAQAFVRTEAGKSFVQSIPVKIPADAPAGSYLVYVGDGSSLQQVAASKSFTPKSIAEMVKVINQIKKNDRLYLQITRVSNGAIIGSSEMPNLPPSVLATLNNDRAVGGITPTILSPIVEQELPPAEFVIIGQQVLSVEVRR